MSSKMKKSKDLSVEDEKFPLPIYKKEDDIYSKEKEEHLEEDELENSGAGLDVPGAELDDADENIGEEDEENNYYSLGGGDHDDLEEDPNE
jgi:hypothetical protein